MLREITPAETDKLLECMKALADHHNRVSLNFQGRYPFQPFAYNLQRFSRELREGSCRIAVTEEDDRVLGFCKADLHNDGTGKLDYLIVLEAYRGRGYGRALMDWAMRIFDEAGITRVDVKVAAGNDAVRFYEAYGFRMSACFLTAEKRPPEDGE